MKFQTSIKTFENFDVITIFNNDFYVQLINLGATIVDLKTLDLNNNLETVILNFNNIEDYINNSAYLGATVGPTAGRIAKGRFSLNQENFNLEQNDGNNNLHGGNEGLHNKLFHYSVKEKENEVQILFNYQLKSKVFKEQNIKIKYTIKQTTLKIEYNVKALEDTLCNLTNHVHFNLSGNLKSNILNHDLKINADYYGNLNDEMIAKLEKVENTIFDFRESKKIGKDIEQLESHVAIGWDNPWILNSENALVYKDEVSKRILEVKTNNDSVVVYSCNYPNDDFVYPGRKVRIHDGIAFECQSFPNGINMKDVNRGILYKNETYYKYIEFKFKIDRA